VTTSVVRIAISHSWVIASVDFFGSAFAAEGPLSRGGAGIRDALGLLGHRFDLRDEAGDRAQLAFEGAHRLRRFVQPFPGRAPRGVEPETRDRDQREHEDRGRDRAWDADPAQQRHGRREQHRQEGREQQRHDRGLCDMQEADHEQHRDDDQRLLAP
jgi:hypothetical protein